MAFSKSLRALLPEVVLIGGEYFGGLSLQFSREHASNFDSNVETPNFNDLRNLRHLIIKFEQGK